MPRKEFEAFTRLDASDVNTFLMDQSVMSFAGTAARSSAIPSPVTGMTTYLEDSKDLQIYDGSSYLNVDRSGFVHLNTQTFSAVSSFSFPDSSFSSVFDTYKITFVHESGSTAQGMSLRLRASGVDASSSNYFHMNLTGVPNSGFFTGINSSSVAMYPGNRNAGFSEINIINPFKAIRTMYQFNTGTVFTGGPTEANLVSDQGFFNLTTVFDSVSFIASTGNFTGYAQLYGLRK
jgi:hypothetical protein